MWQQPWEAKKYVAKNFGKITIYAAETLGCLKAAAWYVMLGHWTTIKRGVFFFGMHR